MTRPTTGNPETKKLLRDLDEAKEALERGDHQGGREMFERIRVAAGRHGIRSGHVAWGLAIACDYLGDLEAAMQHINEALELDPLAVPVRRSFEVITRRIREELLRPSRAADDESTPRLYEILVQAQATDDEAVHLIQARYLLTTGDLAAAQKLADAVVTIFPTSASAWTLRAELALAAGEHEAAALARAEAAALGHEPVPFSVPGRAEG